MAKPAYQRIKDAILASIHQGVWQVGQAIPTEHTLAQSFGVSRMTVNRALKELTKEQVLQRRQGAGTFVAQDKFNHTFVTITNIASDITAQNKAYKAQVIDKGLIDFHQLPQSLQQGFIAPTNVCQVQIVHFADETPIQFEERWVDSDLVPDFIHQDFGVVNTSDYLLANVPLQKGDYRILATRPKAVVANHLRMDKNDPALLLTRRTFCQERVVTIVHMWHLGEGFCFSGEF